MKQRNTTYSSEQTSFNTSESYHDDSGVLEEDVNAQNEDGYTDLHYAIAKNDKELAEYLLKHGANVDMQSKSGLTALHGCAKKNNEKLAKLLLKYKANVNMQDGEGCTALHHAVIENCEELAELLLKYEANVDIQSESGCTALHYAIIENNNEKLAKLLLKYKANVNIQDGEGRTALHHAVIENCDKLVELLLEYGANVNIQDEDGYTALDYALKNNNELEEDLKEHGANVNVQDKESLYAAKYCCIQIILCLVESGVSVKIDKGGRNSFEKEVQKEELLVQDEEKPKETQNEHENNLKALIEENQSLQQKIQGLENEMLLEQTRRKRGNVQKSVSNRIFNSTQFSICQERRYQVEI